MQKIISLLDEGTVLPLLEAKNKEEVLNKLIACFQPKVDSDELESIRTAVFEREQIMSTGVGKGLAIPHGKSAGIKDNYAAFGHLKTPVDFGAIDDEPVSLVFLLVGPQSSNSLHIKMLSRISRLMNDEDFRKKIMNCDTAKDMIRAFEEQEHYQFGG